MRTLLNPDLLEMIVARAQRAGSTEERTWEEARRPTVGALLGKGEDDETLPRGLWLLSPDVDSELWHTVAFFNDRWWYLGLWYKGGQKEAARSGFLPVLHGGVPVPRFSLNARAFVARAKHTTEDTPCPDCAASGKWRVLSKGETVLEGEVECPRCRGKGQLQLPSRAPEVSEVTLRRIKVETSGGWNQARVEYCSGESGGSIYYEWDLFDSREEAMAQAELLAAEERDGLDKGPEKPARDLFRDIRYFHYRDALVEEAQSEMRRVRYDYGYLQERCMELIGEEWSLYIGEGGVKDDEGFEEAVKGAGHPDKPTRELIAAWLMSGGLGARDSKAYLEWKAEKRKECHCD